MTSFASYDKSPYVAVDPDAELCAEGWPEIVERLRGAIGLGRVVLCVECYPGVLIEEIVDALRQGLGCRRIFLSEEAFRLPDEVDEFLKPYLTDDPVFGVMNGVRIEDLFDPAELQRMREQVQRHLGGLILVIGTGASLVVLNPDCLVYADLARWTIQLRQRNNRVHNLGVRNELESPGLKYKRAFFVDWRAADCLKQSLFKRMSYVLDTNIPGHPKMIAGSEFCRGLAVAARRPFRVVPFFDPGPWGGRWMMEKFDLPRDTSNYAWCFDCVPEENSLLLGFGHRRIELPALDLVFLHPRELLGDSVFHRFGAEFPIRFDFLDTMAGGNLSLQVHPLAGYIREQFGMSYTQDESYYMVDAAADSTVFLGLKEGVDRQQMAQDLYQAQKGGLVFPTEHYVNAWPARKHDHFLIPAGTVHCSGRNGVVLEISATPFIFTFKLWDWERLGLDGKPRPIHLDHGLANIQWDRTTHWVQDNLINRVTRLEARPAWREERTGLHGLEFIETRRHWFTGATLHHTEGTVNVLNLVEGEEVVVESPESSFEPLLVHYAETFIVPAAVGSYSIRPVRPTRRELGIIKAYVRDSGHDR